MCNFESIDFAVENNALIKETDTRDMVRLLGEVAGRDSALAEKRIKLMDGISELIDADAWVWTLMGNIKPGEVPSFSVFLTGGMTDEQIAGHLKANEHPDMGRLQEPFLRELADKNTHLTRLRQQITSDESFHGAEVAAMWKKNDLGPVILSFRPNSSGQVSGIVFFRRFDRPVFDTRESRIAHIMLSEVPWLHDDAWPNHPAEEVRKISPRLNTVLSLLIQGFGRKQISAELGITINTVNGYAKDLYRRFDVHSQAELIRRFVVGDGGDTPHPSREAKNA